MAAALRTVCVLAALCGTTLRAAPTVTYDQRQNGEYNLQVDVDGVAIVLLPSADDLMFDRSAGNVGGVALQTLGRRAGVHPRKKKKPVTNCTAVATSEKPYTAPSSPPPPPPKPSPVTEYPTPVPEYPSSQESDEPKPIATVTDYPSQASDGLKPLASVTDYTSQTSGDPKPPAPVSESDRDNYLVDDPYSVTPITPNQSKNRVRPEQVAPVEMVEVQTVKRPATGAGAFDSAVETAEKPVDAADALPQIPQDTTTNAVVKRIEAFIASMTEETPTAAAPVPSAVDVKIAGETDANDASVKPTDAKTESKSNETTVAKTPERVDGAETVVEVIAGEGPQAVAAVNDKPATGTTVTKTVGKLTFAEALKTSNKPAEADTAATTAAGTETISASVDLHKKPVADALPEKSSETPATAPVTVNSGRTDLPVEMVPIKPVENPTSVDVLKANKPSDVDTAVRVAAVTEVTASTGFHKEPTTLDTSSKKSANSVTADIQNDATVTQVNGGKTNKPAVEMVAMKTVEKPTSADASKLANKPVNADTTFRTAVITEATVVSGGFHKKPAIPDATLEKSAGAAVAMNAGTNGLMNGGRTDLPVEMVAMKTADKSTSTNEAMITKHSAVVDDTVSDGKDAAEPVATKTSGTPVGTEGDIKMAANVKPSEVQGNDKIDVVSGFVLKPATEMVAVKTMESPATVMTVKTVTSMKTSIKSGTPKTAISSNGSSIVRKVADRKPLPTMILQVATPKVVFS